LISDLKDDIDFNMSPIEMCDFVRHTCIPLLVYSVSVCWFTSYGQLTYVFDL